MRSTMWKSTFREIKQSFGRFMAIFAIIALGVALFAGLKVLQPAMVKTTDTYYKEKNFYDYRILSTLGFEQEDADLLKEKYEVRYAQGAVSFDILCTTGELQNIVLKALSFPENISMPQLLSGRFPEKANECVADSAVFTEDQIGQKIYLTGENEDEDLEKFSHRAYTITGIVQSPDYIQFERGNTSLGNGKITGFFYLPLDGFDTDYFTEILVKFDEEYEIYSDAYDAYMDQKEAAWETYAEEAAMQRYDRIVAEAEAELLDARVEFEQEKEDAQADLLKAKKELDDAKADLFDAQKQLSDGETELQEAKTELSQRREELSKNVIKLQKAENSLSDFEKNLEPVKAEFSKNWAAIREGEEALAEAEAELLDAEKKLAENRQKLSDGWKEYQEGLAEYEEGVQEFETQIKDAEAELLDAEQEIAEIEKPEIYVLGRETNVGYVCFQNDSAIVDGIANVFPVFFYAVAALVCITTMSRMVEEQRTQIGVLKALGYRQSSIMGKYLFYSGLAAISGCIFGYFFGIWFFPKVIWYAYGTMYDVDEIIYVFDAGILIFSLLVSMACSMGATYFTCRKELSEVAAELMRPKAPKAGKRVLLERIPWIWQHLKFSHKVSYRNVFRYKKRFFMMVIGISGCTGLVLTGFGVQDSIASIADDQYEKIQVYDINVMLTEEVSDETKHVINDAVGDRMEEAIYVMEKSMDLTTENAVKGVSLVAVDEAQDLSSYVVLQDAQGNPLEYPKSGECILTDQIAETYELKEGDLVTLTDEHNHSMELKVAGITENYLYNFVYMTIQTYEEALGEMAEVKSIYINGKEGVELHEITADLMKEEVVASALVSADSKARFSSMIDSLDLLVVVIIACAAFLAFIVLYNLTNINITERIREIATIKVLGFYKNETASYIFRENLILTLIGSLAGLLLGNVFHAFVMSQVKVDQVSFQVRILPESYLYSILLTFIFAMVVNLFMGNKLERISMTESLKSVD